MDTVSANVVIRDRLTLISLQGELDADTTPDLQRRLWLLSVTNQHLVLDISGVRFCGAAGLNLFLALRARTANGSLHLATPSPTLRRLLTSLDLHEQLPVVADVADAITKLGRDVVRPDLDGDGAWSAAGDAAVLGCGER